MAVDPMLYVEGGRALLDMFGAKKASDASADAARIQSQAATEAARMMRDGQREALDFQREVYNQGRADQQPWIGAGQGAVGKLAHLMGIEMGGGFSPLQASGGGSSARLPQGAGMFPGASRPTPSLNGGGSRGTYRWPGAEPTMEERQQYTSDMREDRRAIRTSRPGFVPRRTAQPQTVTMQAPNGEIEDVPMDEVDAMTQAGAVVLR